LQDHQKGDIKIKMTWTSVELDAESDIKGEDQDDEDDDTAEEAKNAPVHNATGGHGS